MPESHFNNLPPPDYTFRDKQGRLHYGYHKEGEDAFLDQPFPVCPHCGIYRCACKELEQEKFPIFSQRSQQDNPKHLRDIDDFSTSDWIEEEAFNGILGHPDLFKKVSDPNWLDGRRGKHSTGE